LSRRADHAEILLVEQIMIADKKFRGFAGELKEDLINNIIKAQQEDPGLQGVMELCKKENSLPKSILVGVKDYEVYEDLLWYKGKIVVPEDRDCRLAIMRLHHDSPIAGHQGHARTLELVSRCYYWPGMKQSVKKYVDSCKQCQKAKEPKRMPR
jgi:hypothetical protein